MLPFEFGAHRGALRVLALGAHSDDIEIGAGGTILHLIEQGLDLDVSWVVVGACGKRRQEAEVSARAFLDGASRTKLIFQSYPDSFFPYHGEDIKQGFQQLAASSNPDLVLTHYRNDLHQDHRLVSELTWNAFRNHLILEYEIPKFDGDLGSPNLFVPLTAETCRRKLDLLIRCFGSQRDKTWFSDDVFLSLLRLRGVEAASPTRYAEAFYARKVVL
ncbi:MAG TPA: PIG-L deacetylase family protein [Chloroflexota bacterium]|nr:PIG-L deacetylase family protein [Chloroflexota bacterium]